MENNALNICHLFGLELCGKRRLNGLISLKSKDALVNVQRPADRPYTPLAAVGQDKSLSHTGMYTLIIHYLLSPANIKR